MNPLEVMRARLAELRTEIDGLYEARGAIIDKAAAEKRGFTDAEQAEYDRLGDRRTAAEKELGPVTERVSELTAQADREARAATTATITGPTAQVTEPEFYRKDNLLERSFFRDLYLAQTRQDAAASDRLRRAAQARSETRALGNTGAAGGSGGLVLLAA